MPTTRHVLRAGAPAIVGGLLVSQLLTLFTTPVIYLYMERARAWITRDQVSWKTSSACPAAMGPSRRRTKRYSAAWWRP